MIIRIIPATWSVWFRTLCFVFPDRTPSIFFTKLPELFKTIHPLVFLQKWPFENFTKYQLNILGLKGMLNYKEVKVDFDEDDDDDDNEDGDDNEEDDSK